MKTHFISALTLLATFTAASARVVRRQATSSTSPIAPSQDPWYTAPNGFANYPPGTVFKVRDAPGLVTAIANVSAAYNILYRTTDSQYHPSWAVTTLLLPSSSNATNGTARTRKFLSYGLPYDSADLDASPSYALYTGGGVFGTGEISTALGRGWAVGVADYEGPLASFTAGVQSGHATLDSVRAVFACPEFHFNFNKTTYALWGYSGGALASEWATELQVQYAPELKFAGAALGGLTPNVSSVLLTINGTLYAGLAPSGILGLASQYPELAKYVEAQLFPTGLYSAAKFNMAKNYTLVQSIGAFAGQDISKYFKDGFDTLDAPIAQKVINSDGVMGYHGVPQVPIFAYKAIGDDISVIADTDTLVNRYCGVGATINYQRNTVGNHATELNNGRARALAFLDKIFAGTYNATGCQISNVTVSG